MGYGDGIFLYDEDGSSADIDITVTLGDGTVIDDNGNEIDPMEPSAPTI